MLQISGLTKRYDDDAGLRHVALDRIDLAVGEHEAVALVGTSGCGKTTLLRIISGLERATDGRLTLQGDAVTGPRRDVGVVFQEPRLMPWLTARENVRLALLDLAPAAQDAVIAALLRDVGLTDFAERFHASCPAAWRSASPSRAPLPASRQSCCSMSRSARSIASRG